MEKLYKEDVSNLSVLINEKLLVFDLKWTMSDQIIYQIAWTTIYNGYVIDKYFHNLTVKENENFTYNNNDKLSNRKKDVRDLFLKAIEKCDTIISHNLLTDLSMLEKNDYVCIEELKKKGKSLLCSMYGTQNLVKTTDKNGKVKVPRLEELYKHLFGKSIPNDYNLHNAGYDTQILCKCVLKLLSNVKQENYLSLTFVLTTLVNSLKNFV